VNFTVFQWVVFPPLVLLALLDGYRVLFAKPTFRRDRFLRFVVWLVAAAAVFNPALASEVAAAVGIGRGTDLVLYLFVVAFLFAAFYFYSRSVRTERQLTQVVRHIAVMEAKRGAENANRS
jgi:small membrane protein